MKTENNTNGANGASDELELTAKERETSAKDTPPRVILLAPNNQVQAMNKFHELLKESGKEFEIFQCEAFQTQQKLLELTTDVLIKFHQLPPKATAEQLELTQNPLANKVAQRVQEIHHTLCENLTPYEILRKFVDNDAPALNYYKNQCNQYANEIKQLLEQNEELLKKQVAQLQIPKQDIKQNLIYKPPTSKFVNALQEIEPVKELTKYEVFKSKQKHVHIYFSFLDTSAIDEQLEHPLTYTEQLVLRACISLFVQGVSTMTINQIYSHMAGGIRDKSGEIKTRKASNGIKKDIEKALRHLKAIMIKLDCTEHFRLKRIDREQVDKDLLENGIHRSLLDTVEITIQTANGKIEKGVQVVAPPPLLLYSEKLNELDTIEASENRLAFEGVKENNVRASLQNIWIKDYLLQRENILEYKQEQVKKGKLKKSKLKNYRNIDMRRVYKLLGKENSTRKAKQIINKNTRIMMNRYAMKFNLTNETK